MRKVNSNGELRKLVRNWVMKMEVLSLRSVVSERKVKTVKCSSLSVWSLLLNGVLEVLT